MAAAHNGADSAFRRADDGHVDAPGFDRQAGPTAIGVVETAPRAARYRRAFDVARDETGAAPAEPTAVVALTPATARLRGLRTAEFTAPDHDDATITRAEFTRLLTALGQPPTTTEAAFTALDRDHDDRITRAEYVAAWEDYLLSDTPDTACALAFTGL